MILQVVLTQYSNYIYTIVGSNIAILFSFSPQHAEVDLSI
jgi:hypothetical protein